MSKERRPLPAPQEEEFTGPDGQTVSMEQMLKYLTRLDSVTNSRSGLSAADRLAIVQEMNRLGMLPAAGIYGYSRPIVYRAIRDINAILAYLSGQTGSADPELQPRLARLRAVEKELKLGRKLRYSPPMRRVLKKLPHVTEIVDHYLKCRNITELFATVDVPVSTDQERSLIGFLSEKDGSEFLGGLAPLARRFLFGKWLAKDKGIPTVAEAACYILTADTQYLDRQQRIGINLMRTFLGDMARQEYLGIVAGLEEIPDWVRECFPFTAEGLDTAAVYEHYASQWLCPLSLQDYARQVVLEQPAETRIANLLPNEYYSTSYRINLDLAGMRFLETALIKGLYPRTPPLKLSHFLRAPREMLWAAKATYLKKDPHQHPRGGKIRA